MFLDLVDLSPDVKGLFFWCTHLVTTQTTDSTMSISKTAPAIPRAMARRSEEARRRHDRINDMDCFFCCVREKSSSVLLAYCCSSAERFWPRHQTVPPQVYSWTC